MRVKLYFLISYVTIIGILYISFISIGLNPFYYEIENTGENYSIRNDFQFREYIIENIDDELLFTITQTPANSSNQLFIIILFIMPIFIIGVYNLIRKKDNYKPLSTTVISGIVLMILVLMYIFLLNEASNLIS
ncbi:MULTISPECIES: hypothetical protein [Allobacillus]|uniref:Uncharacterized protein n=1 Tax=Allobacillus salarius TaxID=1955272 RepID=A0A556P8T6_9BACI|nr:hypothetical protein [Allobacillus salarius]TSJ60792.1 hypothetical protein FPQ13_11570 [Allobacillus salarius]